MKSSYSSVYGLKVAHHIPFFYSCRVNPRGVSSNARLRRVLLILNLLSKRGPTR